jgi:hypothetical protein
MDVLPRGVGFCHTYNIGANCLCARHIVVVVLPCVAISKSLYVLEEDAYIVVIPIEI